jgi:hypothetical protein
MDVINVAERTVMEKMDKHGTSRGRPEFHVVFMRKVYYVPEIPVNAMQVDLMFNQVGFCPRAFWDLIFFPQEAVAANAVLLCKPPA